MSNIFNLFGDSTVAKAPPFGSVSSNANSGLKLKNVGAPGATPGKIFGQKSKGLSIRSISALNIQSSTNQSFGVKKDGAGTSFLKPIDVFGKSTSPSKPKSPNKQKSPNRQKSPSKLKSPKKLFEISNPAPIAFSPNAKTQTNEKSEEIVFKKPKTPRKIQKNDMDYPEPEGLAPIGDIDTELFDLTNQNFLKLFNNKYFLADVDEGFLSDTEPVPINTDEIRTVESESEPEDTEVPLPELTPLPVCDETPTN